LLSSLLELSLILVSAMPSLQASSPDGQALFQKGFEALKAGGPCALLFEMDDMLFETSRELVDAQLRRISWTLSFAKLNTH
jgi:hypothetical protein